MAEEWDDIQQDDELNEAPLDENTEVFKEYSVVSYVFPSAASLRFSCYFIFPWCKTRNGSAA